MATCKQYYFRTRVQPYFEDDNDECDYFGLRQRMRNSYDLHIALFQVTKLHWVRKYIRNDKICPKIFIFM